MLKSVLTLLLLVSAVAKAPADAGFDAIVDAGFLGQAGTSNQETPVYATITSSLEAVKDTDSGIYRVLVKAGTYREKLTISRPDVHFVGEGRDRTVISWGDTGSTIGPDGQALGTWGSATLIVEAPGFHIENLTIENSFDYTANLALPEDDPNRVTRMQAVALMTTGESDRAVFKNVTINGFQDTLFVDAGRHYFKGCEISGHVDFIFGAGAAVFDNCEIVSRHRPNKDPSGYITAPSTNVATPYGLLFFNSRFLRESPDVAAGSVRLGRPWHPRANPAADGSAVFIDCYMDEHIGPEGYAPISGTGPDGVKVWFEVDERSRFFEHGSHGPGGTTSDQRPQLTAKQAAWYTPEQVLNGWRPFED